MAKTAVIQTRISPEIKAKAQKVLDDLNMSMSEAISVYLTQITLHNGIPFEIKIPTELTAKTLRDSEEGKGLHSVDNEDNLFDELES
ncbi:type II toxin-antitoxin system RelB/DinJ family antitoxin [candidate division KSB1 bacterium]